MASAPKLPPSAGSLIPERPLETLETTEDASTDWPFFSMGQPLVDLTKALALASELDNIEAIKQMRLP